MRSVDLPDRIYRSSRPWVPGSPNDASQISVSSPNAKPFNLLFTQKRCFVSITTREAESYLNDRITSCRSEEKAGVTSTRASIVNGMAQTSRSQFSDRV